MPCFGSLGGGALRLIATQPGIPQLSALYRFRDPAEATATPAPRR
jgi:hypothetical protein